MGPSVEKMFTYFKNHDLGLCLLLRVLNCYWGICLQCSQIATKGAPPPAPAEKAPCPPLRTLPGWEGRVRSEERVGRGGRSGEAAVLQEEEVTERT